MDKTTQPTQFKLIILLICIFALGFFIYLNQESKSISNFHNTLLPEVAQKSFFIGCMSGSKGDSEFCNRMSESYKYDIIGITKIEE